MTNPRALLAAGVVLVAVVAGLAFVPGMGGDSSGDGDTPRRVVRAELTLEYASRPDSRERELLVSLPGYELNRLDVTGGETLVWLRCFDSSGGVAIRRAVDWPLLEEEGYPPHIHQPADRQLIKRIRGCRLTGPGINFEGLLPAHAPNEGTS